MRLADPFFNALIPRCCFGGGSVPEPEPIKIPPPPPPIVLPPPPPMPEIQMPEPLTADQIQAMLPPVVPPTPVPPPPTTSPLEAQDIADEERRKQAGRQGYSASIIAGEQQRDYVSSATGTGSLLG